LLIVGIGHDADGRGTVHLSPPPLEGARQVARTTVGGDHHRAAGQCRLEQPARTPLALSPDRTAFGMRRSARATSPNPTTAGLRTSAAAAASSTPASVLRVVRWRGVWPFSTIATGRSPLTPCASAARTTFGSAATPISITVVAVGSSRPWSIAVDTSP